jgi:RNA polymerase sigma factor (sigma-70 family)
MATAQTQPLIRFLPRLVPDAALPDGELLGRFTGQGDEAAFAALVRRHGPMVLGVCRRVLRDHHAAEDCLQATFLVLAHKAGSLQRPEALGPWLHGVASRTAHKARAQALRRRALERRAGTAEAVEGTDDLTWRELRPVLDEAVAALPEQFRVPFVLHYLQGVTVTEVARQLGWPRGTVATRLARARERLRARLARQGLTLSAAALAAALSGGTAVAGVPVPLLVSTARVAAVAAGQPVAVGTVAAKATALARAGGEAMVPTKVKVAAAVLVLAVGVFGAAALCRQRPPAGAPKEDAPARGKAGETPAPPAASVVARVNSEVILGEDLRAAAYLALPSISEGPVAESAGRDPGCWKETLERLIEREVVLQDAVTVLTAHGPKTVGKLREAAAREFDRQWAPVARRNAGLKEGEELRALLRSRGTSLEAMRRQWERDFLARAYLLQRVSRSPDAATLRVPAADADAGRQQAKRIIADLKRRAVIEYVGGP